MNTRLKEIRKAKGFKSAKAFADSIGMQEKTYRNYEQGARNLYLDVACQLCTALGCTLDELVGNEPKHHTAQPSTNDERELLALYRNMDDKHQSLIIENARSFSALSIKDGARATEDVERAGIAVM